MEGRILDFEAAIANGATHIRVGSAIFGARDADGGYRGVLKQLRAALGEA